MLLTELHTPVATLPEVDGEKLWDKSNTGRTTAELLCLSKILQAAVKLSTYSFIPAAHSHTNLCSAGSPSTTPHIPKAVAKELNKELQQCGWKGTCLSEKIYGVKVSTGSLASWDFPVSTAQPTLFSHCLILLFCQNYVLPREE